MGDEPGPSPTGLHARAASELHVPGYAPTLAEGVPKTLSQEQVPGFLEPYGYVCRDALEWRQWDPLPQLTLRVTSHTKVNGHTYYHVDGALAKADRWHLPYLQWQVALRLSHLRMGLHDPVKRELGKAGYNESFKGAPFAQRHALHGTTARLNLWCQRLAQAVNEKAAPPTIVATILRLLRVPELPEDTQPDDIHIPSAGAADDRNPFSAELPKADRVEDIHPDPSGSEVVGAAAASGPEPCTAELPVEERAEAVHRGPGGPGSTDPPDGAACQEGSECSSEFVGNDALADMGCLSEESV